MGWASPKADGLGDFSKTARAKSLTWCLGESAVTLASRSLGDTSSRCFLLRERGCLPAQGTEAAGTVPAKGHEFTDPSLNS